MMQDQKQVKCQPYNAQVGHLHLYIDDINDRQCKETWLFSECCLGYVHKNPYSVIY